MAELQYETVQSEKVTASMSKETRYFGDGDSQYTLLENNEFRIALFPSKAEPKPDAKSILIASAQITHKDSGFSFRTNVRQFVESGEIAIGSRGKKSGFQAMVTQYDKEAGKEYEYMTVPHQVARRIKDMIAAGVHDQSDAV